MTAPKPTTAAAVVAAETAPPGRLSLVASFASRYQVEPAKLMATLKETAFKTPGKGEPVSDAQMMALLVVANEYKLNPFTKEIYAFPAQGGGIVPIISIDGWIRIINERPELASIKFEYPPDGTDKADWWVGCTITRRDRDEPVTIREYYAECYRDTVAWNGMGRRMLRHKALIQCARIAFGYGGIYDPDEAERVANAMAVNSTAREVPQGKPATREPQAKQIAPPAAATAPTIAEIEALLDSTGVPLSELLAHFELGDLSELLPSQRVQAVEWLL